MCTEHRQARITNLQDRNGSGHGLGRIKNGQLLQLISADFDVFITSDKNLRYQQNLDPIEIAVILLPSNQVPIVTALLPEIDQALSGISGQDFIEI